MTKYEALRIELVSLDTSDVIATSAEVTTGSIAMPWQTATDTTPTTVSEYPYTASAYDL